MPWFPICEISLFCLGSLFSEHRLVFWRPPCLDHFQPYRQIMLFLLLPMIRTQLLHSLAVCLIWRSIAVLVTSRTMRDVQSARLVARVVGLTAVLLGLRRAL